MTNCCNSKCCQEKKPAADPLEGCGLEEKIPEWLPCGTPPKKKKVVMTLTKRIQAFYLSFRPTHGPKAKRNELLAQAGNQFLDAYNNAVTEMNTGPPDPDATPPIEDEEDHGEETPVDTILLLIFYGLSKLGQILMLDVGFDKAWSAFGWLGKINLVEVNFTNSISFYEKIAFLSMFFFVVQMFVLYEINNPLDLLHLNVAQLESYFKLRLIDHAKIAFGNLPLHYVNWVYIKPINAIGKLFPNERGHPAWILEELKLYETENTGLENMIYIFFFSVIFGLTFGIVNLTTGALGTKVACGAFIILAAFPSALILSKYEAKKSIKEHAFDYYEDEERADQYQTNWNVLKWKSIVFIWLLISVPTFSACFTVCSGWNSGGDVYKAGAVIYSVTAFLITLFNAYELYRRVKRAADVKTTEQNNRVAKRVAEFTRDCKFLHDVGTNTVGFMEDHFMCLVPESEEFKRMAELSEEDVMKEKGEHALSVVLLGAFLSGFTLDLFWFKFVQLFENVIFSAISIFSVSVRQTLIGNIIITFSGLLSIFTFPYESGLAFLTDLITRFQTLITLGVSYGRDAGTINANVADYIVLIITALVFWLGFVMGANPFTKAYQAYIQMAKALCPREPNETELEGMIRNDSLMLSLSPYQRLETLCKSNNRKFIAEILDEWKISVSEMNNFVQSELKQKKAGEDKTKQLADASTIEKFKAGKIEGDDMSVAFKQQVKKTYRHRLITPRMNINALRELGFDASEIIVYGEKDVVTESKIEHPTEQDELLGAVYTPGTLVYYREKRPYSDEYDLLPAEISRRNFNGTYNLDLEDGRYMRNKAHGYTRDFVLISQDKLISDGRETKYKPITKVSAITNEQLLEGNYNWFNIIWARVVLSTKTMGTGSYFRDIPNAFEEFGYGFAGTMDNLFGWIHFGEKFEDTEKPLQFIQKGTGKWLNGYTAKFDSATNLYSIYYPAARKRIDKIPKQWIRFKPEKDDTSTCGDDKSETKKYILGAEIEFKLQGQWTQGTIYRVLSGDKYYIKYYTEDSKNPKYRTNYPVKNIREPPGMWGFLPWV